MTGFEASVRIFCARAIAYSNCGREAYRLLTDGAITKEEIKLSVKIAKEIEQKSHGPSLETP